LSVILITVSAVYSQINIACVGNSITEAGGYVQFLNSKLGADTLVQNFGIGSQTILKNGDDTYWDEPKFMEVFDLKPQIMTIMLGTNDSKPQNWGPYSSEFKGDLQAMVDTFSTLDPMPIIFLILPPHAADDPSWIRGSIIRDEIVPLITNLAQENKLPLIDLNTPTQDKLILMPDGVHPNAEGHLFMGEIILKSLQNQQITSITFPQFNGTPNSEAFLQVKDKKTFFSLDVITQQRAVYNIMGVKQKRYRFQVQGF